MAVNLPHCWTVIPKCFIRYIHSNTVTFDTIIFSLHFYCLYLIKVLYTLLGVTISNTLCWDAHIEQLIKKCNSYLFLLSRIKVFLSRRNRILFYNSYMLPHLDLCCIIWGNCSSTLEDKLVRFQKRAARVILDCDFYTPSSELFKELNWQTFPERVTYKKSNFNV